MSEVQQENTPRDTESRRTGPRRGRRGGRGRGGGGANKSSAAWSVDQFQVEPEEGKLRFHDLDLPDVLMHGIADQGFKFCSPIQAAIPALHTAR